MVFFVSGFSENIYRLFKANSEHELLIIFFVISVLFFLSFIVFYISHFVKLPSFVLAIFFGLAAKPLLEPILENKESLVILVGLGATLILFSGGLETPFANFKKLILQIFSLSFPGLIITAFLFSWTIWLMGNFLGVEISIIVSVLLGALLASTDPAAIIPVLKRLRFYNRSVKDIVVSESAVTDVVGTLLTVVFLSLVAGGAVFSGINSWYQSIFNSQSALILLKQLFFGGLMGFFGYLFLELLSKFKKRFGQEFEADFAFFLFVPVAIFTFSLSAGGSGYLAAFVAGLGFHISEHLSETENFFNSLIDGFFKPIIFILLGSLVDVASLIEYAPIGILAALIFMFVIRPIAVFISLFPFVIFGRERLNFRDLLFISFVRETGAIPAVLMVTIISLDLIEMNGLVEIGMWVILSTLILEPVLTVKVAKFLKVAEVITDKEKIKFSPIPKTVLVTRGKSFIERLPNVVSWSKKRSIKKVVILLCLEGKYTEELENEIRQQALAAFEKHNRELNASGQSEIEFSFISRLGMLEDNIEAIATEENLISMIFVGKKMLDYRLNEIKNLSVPLCFVD